MQSGLLPALAPARALDHLVHEFVRIGCGAIVVAGGVVALLATIVLLGLLIGELVDRRGRAADTTGADVTL